MTKYEKEGLIEHDDDWMHLLQQDWLKQGKKPDKDAHLWLDKAFEFFEQESYDKSFICIKIAVGINPNAIILLGDGKKYTARELAQIVGIPSDNKDLNNA